METVAPHETLELHIQYQGHNHESGNKLNFEDA